MATSFRMPFAAVPCAIWLPRASEADGYGNEVMTYGAEPDIMTKCCYAPGSSRPDTAADVEGARPHGARVGMTFFLPKTLVADLRGALIAALAVNDPALCTQRDARDIATARATR